MGNTSMSYIGIGIFQPKTGHNVGTLLRTAVNLKANFVFVIGHRYKKQSSDTVKSYNRIPFYEYSSFQEFNEARPKGAQLVAIELDPKSVPLDTFVWPKQAIILLGAEDRGLPQQYLEKCQHIVEIPTAQCLNVAVAGGIALYHRNLQLGK